VDKPVPGDSSSDIVPRRRREWDGVAAIIAALVGLLALCVSCYTAYIQRQQVRAQVWPYLQVGNFDPEQAIAVLNKGVGPAIVRSAQVWVDGKAQPDWKHVLNALDIPPHGFQDSTVNGTVLSAGERVVMIKIPDEAVYRRFRDTAKARIDMELCFCSTLGECWLYSDRSPTVRASQHAVEQCPNLPAAEIFND
jgi:hypothetical protein